MDAKSGMVRFEDVEMRIHDVNGDRWVTFRDVGAALGHADPVDIRKIIDRNPEEFVGKQGVVRLSTPGGVQDVRVLNYRGVIRVAMKSDAPRAIPFRDWAEEVLFQVMTTGFYAEIDREPHWTDLLSPSEQLRLIELRATIWQKLADRPRNRALWLAHYETYGGRSRYAAYLRRVNGHAPTTNEEWRAFERDIERTVRSPEECFGDIDTEED